MSWKLFWNQYRKIEPQTEEDLLVQVGRTINSVPISSVNSEIIFHRLKENLALFPEMALLDLCCGNGIYTYKLAALVRHAVGVDFSEHLIKAARAKKNRNNLRYIVGDATDTFSNYLEPEELPDRILMNAALAYFDTRQLQQILQNAFKNDLKQDIRFLATDVPYFPLMDNFYNTPERRQRYQENQKKLFNDNDGLGRWWTQEEIEFCAMTQNVEFQILSQPQELSNYRVDILFKRRG